MKPKTTIILLVIAVLIGGFVWYDHTHLPDTAKSNEQKKRIFPNFKSADVTKLEFQSTNGVIVVEKAGDKWDMKQPFPVRANKSTVDSVLSDLEFLDAERTMTAKDLKGADATMAGYGLEKPRIALTLTVGGKPQTITLGDESKVGDNVYATVAGTENVYVISKRLVESLSKSVDDMRDRTVIEVTSSQVNKVELKSGNRQIEVAKIETSADATHGWRITRPITARADQTKVEDIGRKLADLKVETFVTEEPKDLKLYGLDEPAHEVTLFTKGSEAAQIVQFGTALTNDATKVFAKRKATSSIFTVKNEILSNLVVQVNDLRDRALAEFESDQVKAIDLTVGVQLVKLTRGTNDWAIVEPAKLKAEQEACDQFIHHVRDAEIKEFTADVVTDLAQFGLDKPVCEITFKKESVAAAASTNEPPKAATSTNAVAVVATETKAVEWQPLLSIQVGKTDPAKGIVYVKRADEAFVYGLGTNFVADLPKGVLDLRDRTILEIDAASIRKLEIVRGGTQFVAEQVTIKGTNNLEHQEWKLVAPARGVFDAGAVEDLISSLAKLKAARLAAEHASNLAPYGLDNPGITVTLTSVANAASQTHTLLVGAESPAKRRFAALKGNPLVFELDENTTERVMNDFLTKPEPVAAVTNQPPTAAVTNAPAAK